MEEGGRYYVGKEIEETAKEKVSEACVRGNCVCMCVGNTCTVMRHEDN